MSQVLFDRVVTRVVEQALLHIAGVPAVMKTQPVLIDPGVWSWVRIVDPRPGVVVIGMDGNLAIELASHCHDQQLRTRDDSCDIHAELTNNIASHLANEMLGGVGMVILGTPRTGRGRPDFSAGAWQERYFQVCGLWLGVFVQGDDLINPISREAVNAQVTHLLPGGTAAPHGHPFVPVQVSVAPTPDSLPLRIGHYRIIDQLGSGGMGVVYKAYHHTLGRLVALKVIRPELSSDQEFIVRFLREGRAAAAIDHPNVVAVLDAGIDDGYLYMAMHFAAGGDVASLLERSGPLPEARALLLMRDLLSGLQAIADANLIHRDIKPANILLDAHGQPRLADLGLSRSLMGSGLSQPGVALGTPVFMSPEQTRAGPVDIRSDIYGMGSTLYSMLTARTPFQGESPYDLAAQVMYAPVPDPRAVRSDLHQDTAALTMKAMAKDPAQRFQTPDEFRIAVEAALLNHAKVPPPAGNYWLRKLFGAAPSS